MHNRGGGRHKGAPRNGQSKRRSREVDNDDPERFLADLIARMDRCETAESLNDQVIMPFVLALEKVAGARGYAMNVYGDSANLVFTGDAEHAEAIYQIIEAFLDDQQDET